MEFEKIHLIHPISNAAEEEYTKKFLRFIGCQVYGRPVDELIPLEWVNSLPSTNEANGIDIVMNYFGEDPYRVDSIYRGFRRIYFYFDLERGFCAVTTQSLNSESLLPRTKGRANIRQKAIRNLIEEIWKESIAVQTSVLRIYALYFGQHRIGDSVVDNDDLFFLLQTKRCMRVMTMGEVLSDPDAYIMHIPLYSHILHILSRLSDIYFLLASENSIYGLYTRVNAAIAMFGIMEKLYPNDREKIKSNEFNIKVMSEDDVFALIEELLDNVPASISSVLLYARFCKYRHKLLQIEENIYDYLQKLIPENQKGYAYIWYRIGRFYEKAKKNTELALRYYRKAVHLDAECYQAVFKLGYFAALDNCFNEAESRLKNVVEIMFHGRGIGPNIDDEYVNWNYLSLKDCQYAYKAYILLAKIAKKNNREYSARSFVGSACLAATSFEKSLLESKLLDENESARKAYFDYHDYSTPVWSMWKVLKPWSEHLIRDDFVKRVVQGHLAKWN